VENYAIVHQWAMACMLRNTA